MSHPATPMFGEDTYDDVERAVLETPRGRWFLGEYARRNRTADTHAILGAIERIERRLDGLSAAFATTSEPISTPEPPQASAPASDSTPIDALMARLTAALEKTGREMQEAEQANGPATFEAIDALSPHDRLKLFY